MSLGLNNDLSLGPLPVGLMNEDLSQKTSAVICKIRISWLNTNLNLNPGFLHFDQCDLGQVNPCLRLLLHLLPKSDLRSWYDQTFLLWDIFVGLSVKEDEKRLAQKLL